MFGCIVAGRLVQTNPQQLSNTKYLFTIEDGLHVNHIVIFLLGIQTLPMSYGAGLKKHIVILFY